MTPELQGIGRIIEYFVLTIMTMVMSYFLYSLKKQLSDLTSAVRKLVETNIGYGKDIEDHDKDIKALWDYKDEHDKRITAVESKVKVIESHHNRNHPDDRLH